MKSVKIYLSILFFVFTISFAQTKMNIQKADETASSIGESYPVDARSLLEAFDKANGIDYEKAGKPVRLNKATAWNFSVGSTKSWMVSDLRTGAGTPYYPMPSTCRAVGENCYIFVADSVWNTRIPDSVVTKVKETFDLKTPANSNKGIFRTNIDTFGDPPNFDNDQRIIILLFDIKDTYSVTGTGGYTVGYFHSMNQYPKSTFPNSNEAEIFFMDANPLDWTKTTGLNTGLSTLAHEFQHMIHFNYLPVYYDTFFNESWSLVAEVICGYSLFTQSYYNGETNHYLLDWRRDDNTLVLNDYSRAAKFGLYLYEQYGASILKNYLANGVNGVSGIDNYLKTLSPPTDFRTTFNDWLIANYLNDKSVSPGLAKWGYDYSNIIQVIPKTILNPNITNASDAVYKLGAQYISFTSGKNLSINFNTSGSSAIKIKAIKTGTSNKAVDDVTPGINYSVPDFGTTYNNVSFMVYNDNRNEYTQGPFPYSYTSSGIYENTPIEIAYDQSEPTGVLPLAQGDSVAVVFDGISGTRLDSIKVALRQPGSVYGGIFQAATTGNFLGAKKLAAPITVTSTIPTKPGVPYPVPWNNWVKLDLRSNNIDASNSFIVSFLVEGTYPETNRVMITDYESSSSYHSFWYRASTSSWLYYTNGSQPGFIYVNLIRAYVSDKTTGVEKVIELMPSSFSLNQNYPNPFNPSTVISYQLPVAGHVSLKVFDLLGREVATLVDEFQQAGSHNSQFSILNSQLSSGIYFYTIRAGNFVETKKMMLMK